jgi:hypothetical protein
MVYRWSAIGPPLVYRWSTAGLPLVYRWLPLVYPWCWSTTGLQLVYRWSTTGLPLVSCMARPKYNIATVVEILVVISPRHICCVCVQISVGLHNYMFAAGSP